MRKKVCWKIEGVTDQNENMNRVPMSGEADLDLYTHEL